MRLLEMKCDKSHEIVYMVKLETKAEWRVYENFVSYGADKSALDSMIRSCNNSETIMGDDDVTYYFCPLDRSPEIGETFELDDIKWERIG